MMAQAFRLTLEVVTPFAIDYPMTLDGLLSAAVYRQCGKHGSDGIRLIPLEEEEGIFRASSLHYGQRYSHEMVHRVMSLKHERDLSVELFQPNRKRGNGYIAIDQARGAYKANLSNYPAIWAREVFFWGVGDGEACADLIRTYILGVGKRANSGAGQIHGVHLETSPDYSWIKPNGDPARPIPHATWLQEGGSPDAQTAPMAVRLPYWKSTPVLAVFPPNLVA